MRWGAIKPAQVEFHDDGTVWSSSFGDVYHPRAGALAQARHVFLGGCGLPHRWQGRAQFTVLETGFGLGHNFLATWQAWRADPLRCDRLHFVSIERHPVSRAALARVHQRSPMGEALAAAWPPLTPDIHRLAFDEEQVVLWLVLSDVQAAVRELRLTADAVYLDGFAPDRNPEMWAVPVLRALGSRCAPGATLATWSAARTVRDGLRAAGFDWQRADGFAHKRDMTVAVRQAFEPARSQPPRTQAAAHSSAGSGPDVLVLGAGLAGAACARSLAVSGLRVQVLERAAQPASGASGNRAGLFHSVLHAEDGAHARFSRAAALRAERCYRPLVESGQVEGKIDGLLRLERALDVPGMQALIDALGLPADHVQALGPDEAASLSGLPVSTPAWRYTGGGWVNPGQVVRAFLATPGVEVSAACPAASIQHDGSDWLVLDGEGQRLSRAPRLVLAQGADVLPWLTASAEGPWPLGRQRGQITHLRTMPTHWPRPQQPVSGGGYALTLPDGTLLCGATTGRGDEHAEPRAEDDAENLHRLQRLLGVTMEAASVAVQGRVGWRLVADDRLPLAGPMPAPVAPQALRHREVQRLPGLYLCAGLGSRGVTWAPLLGEVIAGWITGSPMPLPAKLLDAIDPARFRVRQARRDSSSQGKSA